MWPNWEPPSWKQVAGWAIGAIAVATAIYTRLGFNRPPASPFIHNDTTTAAISPHLTAICTLHHRIHTLNPTIEPLTLFDVLALDINTLNLPPSAPHAWTQPGDARHRDVKAAILAHWSVRGQRLLEGDAVEGEEDAVLDAATALLLAGDTAGIYILLVMPRLMGLRGAERLEALKEVCGDAWPGKGEGE